MALSNNFRPAASGPVAQITGDDGVQKQEKRCLVPDYAK
jgi:hypothetical protein